MKTLLLPDCRMLVRELVEATAAAVLADLFRPPAQPGAGLLGPAQEQHLQALVEMAQSGEICPRHVLFHTRIQDFKLQEADKAMVLFSDAQIFCRSLDIDLQPEAAPAPVVRERADAEPAHEPTPAATAPKFSMTLAAMKKTHTHEWPTIVRDMKDASKNGLAAAKAGVRDWNEAIALEWARANDKLENAAKPGDALAQSMHSMANLPGKKNILKG